MATNIRNSWNEENCDPKKHYITFCIYYHTEEENCKHTCEYAKKMDLQKKLYNEKELRKGL